MFDPAFGKITKASMIHRDDLSVGQTIEGPALITERETTIVLPTSRRAIQQPDGCIDIQKKG